MPELPRYRTFVYDSARWDGFRFRPDDVVISTPPKSGTTWMQTLCSTLLLGTEEDDRPLAERSPWLDMLTNDRDEVVAGLERQQHRRFIKTHTPLDGLPSPEGVTFICVGRDPRDVAMSFQHHWANLDMDAVVAARAAAVGLDDLAELGPPPTLPDDPAARLRLWIDAAAGSFVGPALVDVLLHIQTFWDRRHRPGVALFHYGDLLADLRGQIRRLAEVLAVEVTDEQVEGCAAAATFDAMKAKADHLVPDVGNRIWRSNRDFFHRGSNGQWRGLLDHADLLRYEQRVAGLVAPDVAAWAHDGWLGGDAGRTGAGELERR